MLCSETIDVHVLSSKQISGPLCWPNFSLMPKHWAPPLHPSSFVNLSTSRISISSLMVQGQAWLA